MFWPVFMGFGAACIASVTLGLSAAIGAPSGYFAWFRSHDASHLGLLLWDLVVVGGLGFGLPAYVAALAAFRLGGPTLLRCALFIVTALACGLLLLPWLHDGLSWDKVLASASRSWWRYGVELALVLAALAALFSARSRSASS